MANHRAAANRMTISYALDISQTSAINFLKLLFRWRGSVWKAVLGQLVVWTVVYFVISLIYRFLLNDYQRRMFAAFATYLDSRIDTNIPLAFMLGFFVTFVVARWGIILNELGWIDNSAICISAFVRGRDDETRVLRRNLVRYMVLTQTLVLRDISMQVRKRFPTLGTIVAAGLLSKEEDEILHEIHDPYSRYWCPIQWCYSLLYDARLHGKIASDFLLDRITNEISSFRHGLASLLKYDWVPVPLVYPQVIFFAVQLYFILCLVSRQFLFSEDTANTNSIDLWLPLTTMIQFVVYMGWMKVAEVLLNPLGEDDDDLECNYIIDKNLTTGLTIVDGGTQRLPPQKNDEFWGSQHIIPLYSSASAKRPVYPLVGSASNVNLVKNKAEIIMTPHKSRLDTLPVDEQHVNEKKVSVLEHNVKAELQKTKMQKKGTATLLTNIRNRPNGKFAREKNEFESGAQRRTNGGTKNVISPFYESQWRRTDHAVEMGSVLQNIAARSPPRDYSPYTGQLLNGNSGLDDRIRAGLRRY